MKIQYKCDYCGKTYDNEKDAYKCEVAHEEWLNSTIEVVDNMFFQDDGKPYEICLRNKSGKSHMYRLVR